jgi:hypothetical protein
VQKYGNFYLLWGNKAMFRQGNEDDLKKAYQYTRGRLDDYFTSSMYTNQVKRYEKRRDAYYMRLDTKTPRWKSRLNFATYFLGVKMLEAQLARSYSGTPFITVQLQPGSIRSPETDEKLRLANFDLNRDINTSRFMVRFDRIRWFMEVAGIGVAREYFVSESQSQALRSVTTNPLGMSNFQTNQQTKIIERTVTEPIHPLNFAQEPTVHEIRDAQWSTVRFPIRVTDLYAMLGDENYDQKNLKDILEQIERGGAPTLDLSDSQTTYYYDQYWDRNERTNNSVICVEVAGDLNYRGNEGDTELYYQLILPQYGKQIRCTKSPYAFKPHWKIACYPDAQTPYAIDPCAMLWPKWQFDNDMMNQYIDYVRSTMRVMYETYDGNILGGLNAIIEGKTFGFVVADTESAFKDNPNGLVRPVRKDQMGMPELQNIQNYMDRYAAQVQPASNLKGVGGESEFLNKTATGIGFQASREDAWVSLLRGPLDNGLSDGMHQKLKNRIDLSAEEQQGDIGGEQYRYFPFEVGGPDYEFEVNKQPPDALIGRIQQALPVAQENFQAGIIDIAGYSAVLRKFFELSGVPGAADMVKNPEMPPMIGGPAAPDAAAGPTGAAASPAPEGTDVKGKQKELRATGKSDGITPEMAAQSGAALALA